MKRFGISALRYAVFGVLLSMAGVVQAAVCPTCAYITSFNSVYSWDSNNNILTPIASNPADGMDSLIFDKNRNLIIDTAHAVYRYDFTTGAMTLLDSFGGSLADMALEPSGDSALVSSRSDHKIYRLNLLTNTHTEFHTAAGPGPHGVIYDEDGNLFAAIDENRIVQFNPDNGAVIRQSPSTLRYADGVTFSTTTHKLYVAGHGGFYVLPKDLSRVDFIALPSEVLSAPDATIDGVGTAGDYLYLMNWAEINGRAIKVDLRTNAVVAVTEHIDRADDIAPLSGLGSAVFFPTLNSLSPATIMAGSPAFTLTVNGSNFVDGAVVNWGGVARTATFVSASQLTITVPAMDVANPGTVQVSVTNPDSRTSGTLPFTITPRTQTLTTIQVIPLSAYRHPTETVPFEAKGFDQDGLLMTGVAFAWDIPQNNSGASINSTTGLYAAGSSGLPATDTVRASALGKFATATVVVYTPGSDITINSVIANPNPVTGTFTQVTVDATGSISGYTWSVVSGPGPVDFSALHSATSRASFTVPGVYVLQVKVDSSTGGPSITGPVTVTVIRTVSSITVTPDGIQVAIGEVVQFVKHVMDQWGHEMTGENVGWTQSSGAASINSASGSFSATGPLQTIMITATSVTRPEIYGTAHVQVAGAGTGVLGGDITNAYAYPVPWKSTMPTPFIIFTKLAPATDIRIFSTNAHLVRKLLSADGTDVHWYIDNDKGERVASGVYYYIIDNDGTDQHVKGKLVVIK